jgi:tetratricopeptide (TPR) repeat protein
MGRFAAEHAVLAALNVVALLWFLLRASRPPVDMAQILVAIMALTTIGYHALLGYNFESGTGFPEWLTVHLGNDALELRLQTYRDVAFVVLYSITSYFVGKKSQSERLAQSIIVTTMLAVVVVLSYTWNTSLQVNDSLSFVDQYQFLFATCWSLGIVSNVFMYCSTKSRAVALNLFVLRPAMLFVLGALHTAYPHDKDFRLVPRQADDEMGRHWSVEVRQLMLSILMVISTATIGHAITKSERKHNAMSNASELSMPKPRLWQWQAVLIILVISLFAVHKSAILDPHDSPSLRELLAFNSSDASFDLGWVQCCAAGLFIVLVLNPHTAKRQRVGNKTCAVTVQHHGLHIKQEVEEPRNPSIKEEVKEEVEGSSLCSCSLLLNVVEQPPCKLYGPKYFSVAVEVSSSINCCNCSKCLNKAWLVTCQLWIVGESGGSAITIPAPEEFSKFLMNASPQPLIQGKATFPRLRLYQRLSALTTSRLRKTTNMLDLPLQDADFVLAFRVMAGDHPVTGWVCSNRIVVHHRTTIPQDSLLKAQRIKQKQVQVKAEAATEQHHADETLKKGSNKRLIDENLQQIVKFNEDARSHLIFTSNTTESRSSYDDWYAVHPKSGTHLQYSPSTASSSSLYEDGTHTSEGSVYAPSSEFHWHDSWHEEAIPTIEMRRANDDAIFLRRQGKFEQAESLDRTTLAEKQQSLGWNHPSTLLSAANLAISLRGQGKYCQAEMLTRQVMETQTRVLGADDERTLTTAASLAYCLYLQQRYQEAFSMQQSVLSKMKRLLGSQHPETLLTESNFALSLAALGEHTAAVAVNSRLLSIMQQVLGTNHPHTRTVVRQLFDAQSNVDSQSDMGGDQDPSMIYNYEPIKLEPAAPITKQAVQEALSLSLSTPSETKRCCEDGCSKCIDSNIPPTLRLGPSWSEDVSIPPTLRRVSSWSEDVLPVGPLNSEWLPDAWPVEDWWRTVDLADMDMCLKKDLNDTSDLPDNQYDVESILSSLDTMGRTPASPTPASTVQSSESNSVDGDRDSGDGAFSPPSSAITVA